VSEAIARQARLLNTNLRYLHETAIELAERLVATTEAGLDVVMFVNSGSEANDLAWRVARAATGGTGGVCTDYAYHGVSEAITALSPEVWGDDRPDHVATWRPRDGVAGFRAALADLAERGHRPAASILDGVLTSDGIIDLDRTVVSELVRLTHDAGAVWIADEVQGGHGRTGHALWSYQRLGITPDLVTLGKPMGNGHPVAAVITTHELAEQFARTTDFFSTFGGNPVAASAALAVLDVLADEEIVANARETGAYLRTALTAAIGGSGRVGEIRGMGLATGVEIVEPGRKSPDPAGTRRIVNDLRRAGVLVGTTARAGNVVKIRPPLVFRRDHADLLVAAINRVLERSSD
jgi:4-aminobutyrate aminotransferase-like enzyme